MQPTYGNAMPLNSDLRQRVAIDTDQLDWQDDVANGVRLKPLAHTAHDPVQRTDIIEYPAGARMDHATLGVAEILVLTGLLEEESGDEIANYPPGSYLKLPSDESAKFVSATGCTLFIKRGHPVNVDSRERIVLCPLERVWHPGIVPGLRVLSLGEFEGAHTALVEWAPGTRFQYHRHYGGEEIFVLEGIFQDEYGDYPAGTWLRSPHMSQHVPFSEPGCLIFVKVGHLLVE
jgi:anti-sigma factor ChrR (cupin superfamily)